MNEYASYIALSRYARWKEDEKRRESFPESVRRYFSYFEERYPWLKENDDWKAAEEEYLNLGVVGSMRALMTAGPALDRDHVAGYNCAYLAVDNVRAFDECMYILLCGTGVGFSVERQYIAKLPEVSEDMYPTDSTIVVADSKIGWAKSFKELVSMLYNGQIPKWDVSKVRPAGAKLKTFGGRASGPQPLVDLFNFTVELFKQAKGRKLTSIEAHDLMCKIADIVVVGGVRRSALISLSNLTDDRMRHAKSGQWWIENPQRALANNSVCYTEKPDMTAFMREWLALVESGSGERGIFYRKAAEKLIPERRKESGYEDYGCNPCCFTGDMKLLTESGYKSFESLQGESVSIVSSDGSITNGHVWCSGEKPTVEVRFAGDKDSITCTSDHVFMLNDGTECEAKDLKGKRVKPFYRIKDTFVEVNSDMFLAGFIQGDGNTTRLLSSSHKGLEVNFGERDTDIADMYCQKPGKWYSREARVIAERFEIPAKVLPERNMSQVAYHGLMGGDVWGLSKADWKEFLSGMYSANGSVIKDQRVAYKTTCKVLAEQLKEVLGRIGIDAYITTNKPTKITFSNGDYVCKESYDVNISRFESVLKFAESISFGQKYKRDALEKLILAKAPYVTSVNDFGVHKVYDFTEPKNHWGVVEGLIVHNSEIVLRSKQFCNLSEVVVRASDTFSDLKTKVKLATILGTLQATLTDFRYLSSAWRKNTEEEALLGVSLTGIMDHPLLSERFPDTMVLYRFAGADLTLSEILQELKKVAIETNKEWADKLGINPAAAITCVKPSGTVSQLVDSASGIHTRHSSYYIRTIRADKKDPLAQMMVDEGFPVEDDVMKPDTGYVFSFPIKSPEGAITRNDRNAIEQLELWKTYQLHWCEHKPSVTISVKDDEWVEVGAWVYENFDIMSGVSFLPHSNHTYQQAPYQEITEEEYEEWLEKMPKDVDWDKLKEYEKDDEAVTGVREYACSASGGCEIN